MRALHTWFDMSDKLISWRLEGIQSPNLARVQDEIAELKKAIKELHKRPFLSTPIIKEIQKEIKVEEIQGVGDLTPLASDVDAAKRGKKRN